MTIDALRRLVELLTDTAGYAAAVDQSAIAADLAQGAAAARRLLLDEERAARQPALSSRGCARRSAPGAGRVMTGPACRRFGVGALALIAGVGGACGRPQPHTPVTTTPPTIPATVPGPGTGPGATGPGDHGAASGSGSTPGGVFGPLPSPSASTTITPAVTTAPAGGAAAGRSDPVAVARAYTTGLFTVDWTKPAPTAQKVAATRPWATPAATAKLAHGEYYQPSPNDPRVASHEVDTVDRVDVSTADPVPGANTYAATVHLTVRSDVGVTASQATVLLTVLHQPDEWLVDDTQVVE